MLHFHECELDIPNREELLSLHQQHGGAIIQYDRVVSALVYTRRTAVYEWVPDNAARRRAGFKHAGWCALLGWWSWIGLIITGLFIFNNLLGGMNVTRILTTPPPLPGQPDLVLRELEIFENRRRWLLFVILMILLGLILWWLHGGD